MRWALPVSVALTQGISVDFFCLRLLICLNLAGALSTDEVQCRSGQAVTSIRQGSGTNLHFPTATPNSGCAVCDSRQRSPVPKTDGQAENSRESSQTSTALSPHMAGCRSSAGSRRAVYTKPWYYYHGQAGSRRLPATASGPRKRRARPSRGQSSLSHPRTTNNNAFFPPAGYYPKSTVDDRPPRAPLPARASLDAQPSVRAILAQFYRPPPPRGGGLGPGRASHATIQNLRWLRWYCRPTAFLLDIQFSLRERRH